MSTSTAETRADRHHRLVVRGESASGKGTYADARQSNVLGARQVSSSWTSVLPKTEVTALFLETDFSPTSLGSIESWGPSLRCYASMVFSDSRAVCLYWGPDMIAIYNDKFAVSCGAKHPAFMGSPLYDFFPEVRDIYVPIFDSAAATGETIIFDEVLLFLERNGYPEETYSCVQHIPVRGDSGVVEGFYTNLIEVTAQVLHARRRRVLDLITAIPPLPVEETLRMMVEALRTNPHDIPAAMIYSLDEAGQDSPNLRLRGSVAVPENHPIAPLQADLDTFQDGLIPLFRLVKRSGRMHVLRADDGSLQKCGSIFEGLTWCGYGEPSRQVVICPLAIGETLIGFYVQGTNPRLPYNEAAEQSISDLSRQIQSKWLASISKQEMERRHAILEERASESEKRLRHMAQNAPVGMVQVGLDYKIQWANEQFYEITGHDRSKPDLEDYRQVLPPEDREADKTRVEAIMRGSAVLTEVRLARKWTPPEQSEKDAEVTSAWMLAKAYPLMENGKVKLLMAYVTDISRQKWAETIQSRNAAAATLAKRRQEEFIDVTCHEMRNPLSAITQLADGIETSMQLHQKCPAEDTWRSIAQETSMAANTILSCAAHQKRVIDDVLMISRLDSDMLSITPVVGQATKVVTSAIQMFEGELKANGTEISAARNDSDTAVKVDCALMDPSRLTQILINLISNAIKFTATQSVRKISVEYGARQQRPQSLRTNFGELTWVSPLDSHRPNTALPDLKQGEKSVYLYFVVQDTGTGISTAGMKKLFKRFSQASSRTHISYGGTGLGLYICRELAEKQGGSVGVMAQHGKGSAFAFYVESRIVVGPESVAEHPLRAVFGSSHPTHQALDASQAHPVNGSIETSNSQTTPHCPFSATTAPSPLHAQPNIHILLVEDNLVNQKVLAKQLRVRQCAVTVANHGEEALRILEAADCWRQTSSPPSSSQSLLKIDIILMDVEMPVMNGLQCAQRIRELQSEGQIVRHLPIIAVTANVRQEQKGLAIAAGMDSVLAKPFTAAEVVKKIQEVLASKDV